MICPHPIVFDLLYGEDWYRACICGHFYNRASAVLRPLREQCERAWKVDFKRLGLSDEDALEIAG